MTPARTLTAADLGQRGGTPGKRHDCPRCGARRTHVTHSRAGRFMAPTRAHFCRHGLECFEGQWTACHEQEPCVGCERRARKGWVIQEPWRENRREGGWQDAMFGVVATRVTCWAGSQAIARSVAGRAKIATCRYGGADARREPSIDVNIREPVPDAIMRTVLRVRPTDFDAGPPCCTVCRRFGCANNPCIPEMPF